MIYKKSLIKEITLTAISVFFVLLVILISTQLINLLGRAADGRVALDAVGTMVAVWVIGLSPLLLILTAFISILSVFSRYWRDSEMAVWLSCGLSLKNWIQPILSFSIPFAIMVAILSFWVLPWTELKGDYFAQVLKQRQDISLVKQGVFNVIGKTGHVYFVEKFDPKTGDVDNVFIREIDSEQNKTIITLAKKGYLTTEDENRVLVLQEGARYIGIPGRADFTQASFATAKMVIDVSPKVIREDLSRKIASTAQLWASKDSEFKGELMWRISMPICVIILSLLALPISYMNTRSGRTYNVIIAIILFFAYQNGLTFLRGLVMDGRITMWLGLIPIHLIMFAIAILFIRYRSFPTDSFSKSIGRVFRVSQNENN